jgi:hypothetical protein
MTFPFLHARRPAAAELKRSADPRFGSNNAMGNNLRSNWSVRNLLAELSEFQRTDDAGDNLAFRLVGAIPDRSVYVYLYGEDPDLIHFDLEDNSIATGEWDHAVRRDSVGTVAELRVIVCDWLHGDKREISP